MKTKPMEHQKAAEEFLLARPEYAALGCEQGTGKTWMLMNDAEKQWMSGKIEAMVIIAPKGVHSNWILREIPTHMSIPLKCEYWLSGAGVKKTRKLERLMRVNSQEQMPILSMNVDAVNTKKGFDFVKRFLETHRSVIIVDESQYIKNPDAKRTAKVSNLGKLAASRRISSGTLVANSPVDLFSQFNFLSPGLLGTTSYRAFVAEYAEILPASSPLVAEIMKKSKRRGTPQIIARDKDGRPKFRNLDKLREMIRPHTFRVTKDECLDLPKKLYQTAYFELSPAQMRLYNTVKDQKRYERDDGEIDEFTSLTIIHKLRQITSGFIMVEGEATELTENAERMQALLDTIDRYEGSVIVWASFREEIRQISAVLKKGGHTVVEYHGGTSDKDREIAVDSFQSGEARFFVANPAAAGRGLTLHKASVAIYYSSSFSYEERSQSEDRPHRIGLDHFMLYIDLAAIGTIDERIAAALQGKKETARQILDGEGI